MKKTPKKQTHKSMNHTFKHKKMYENKAIKNYKNKK